MTAEIKDDGKHIDKLIAAFKEQKMFAESVIDTLEQAKADRQRVTQYEDELKLFYAQEARRMNHHHPINTKE